jgi:hypothetical protein
MDEVHARDQPDFPFHFPAGVDLYDHKIIFFQASLMKGAQVLTGVLVLTGAHGGVLASGLAGGGCHEAEYACGSVG